MNVFHSGTYAVGEWLPDVKNHMQRHDFNTLRYFKKQKAGPFFISTESVSTILRKLNDSAVIFQAKIGNWSPLQSTAMS